MFALVIAALVAGQDTLPAPRPVVDIAAKEAQARLIILAISKDKYLNTLYDRLSVQEELCEHYEGAGFRRDYLSWRIARERATVIKKKIAARKREIVKEVCEYSK